MEKIKKYSNYIIAILVVLFLFNGMKSCSKSRRIKKLDSQIETVVHQKDSVISVLNDSIKSLKNKIDILEVENKGYEKSIEMQKDAISQISSAKKNIHVTVKSKN